jgi:transposase
MLLREWVLAIKKTLRHPKAQQELRHTFQENIKNHHREKRTVVYLDESGFCHDMPRTHGYSVRGKRCHGLRDWNKKPAGRTNVIGALIGKLLLTVGLFTTSITADVFHSWVIQDLLPKLPKNSVVVMDNATFHKRADIKHAFISAGHILEFLPPYSPDLNPIEQKWAKAAKKSISAT